MTSTPALRPRTTTVSPNVFTQLLPLLLPPVVCIGAVLLIWQLLCSGEDPRMPGPVMVVQQTWELIIHPFKEGGLGGLLFTSLQRVALGYLLAVVVGVGVGLLLGASAFVRRGLDPMIQVLRTVPPLAWLPISLGIFQDTSVAALFVIFITAVWPILINTAVGVQQVPQDYNNVAKVLRLSKWEYLTSILIPSTVPYVFTGLRIGIGLAWLAIVAAEMLISSGIGFKIWDAYNAGGSNGMSQVILCVLYVGLVGLVLDRVVGYIGSLIGSEK